MAGRPTYATPAGFLGIGRTDRSAAFIVVGAPMDIGTTNRSGTREGQAYLSFDINALDPSFAPGTGTPEISGLASWHAQTILCGLRFQGMDVVEVAPAYDTAEITPLTAATVVWE